jgi:hypothetical protein
MGIKFHCPNGHKLNVKAFLAGKKGVCPKCGTKVRIPTVSEPGLDDDADAGDSAIATATENSSPKPSNGSARTAAAAPVSITKAPPASAGQQVAVAAVAEAAVPHARASTTPDPIAEQPAAVWYVRPPSGGQYGPARGDVMRKWLSEGRVSGDSLVWREGWTDWQTAGKLFPDLNGPQAAAALGPVVSPAANASAPIVSAPITVQPTSAIRPVRSSIAAASARAGGNGKAIAIVAGLATLCVVLTAVFLYVVFFVK